MRIFFFLQFSQKWNTDVGQKDLAFIVCSNFLPKVIYWFKVGTLCRAIKILHNKLAHPCLYGPGFNWTEKMKNKTLLPNQHWAASCVIRNKQLLLQQMTGEVEHICLGKGEPGRQVRGEISSPPTRFGTKPQEQLMCWMQEQLSCAKHHGWPGNLDRPWLTTKTMWKSTRRCECGITHHN